MNMVTVCTWKIRGMLFFTLFLAVSIYIYIALLFFHHQTKEPKLCLSRKSKFCVKFNSITNFSLIIAVQVHNRISYLKELISSLSFSPDIHKALLIFSHDYFDSDINSLIDSITFCKYQQIFYPYANKTNEGNNLSQVKLHWWWKANQVFRIAARYNHNDLVLFLEEDHFIVEDFMQVLQVLQNNSKKYCQNCIYSLSDNLGYNDNAFVVLNRVSSRGMAFNFTTWCTISACAEKFCKYDDYNWDWSLNYILYKCVKPEVRNLVVALDRVFHIGECGIHHKNEDCNATNLVKKIQNEICKYPDLLYPNKLKHIGELTGSQFQNFGGFKEKEKQELCLSFSASNGSNICVNSHNQTGY